MTTTPGESAAFERAAQPVIDELNGGASSLEVVTGDLGDGGYPCAKCGYPLPPLPDDLQRIVDKGISVVLAHEEGGCPTDVPAAPEGRYFELRVDIVEIVERHDAMRPDDPIPTAVEMMSFVVGQRAKNLDAAMRPLALAFGEKWTAAEKNAGIADNPVETVATEPS